MPAIDADPRYGRFGLRTDCPRCGAHVPVNGLVDQVGCGDCGHHVAIPAHLLVDLLEQFDEEFPEPRTGGTVVHDDLTFRWTAEAVDAPPCGACSEPLPAEALLDPAPSGGQAVTCPACAAEQRVSPVLPSVDQEVASAQLVLGGETDLTRSAVHRDPVALQCPQCGAGLTIGQDRERLTPCDHCGTQVHLPDAVWRALHPPREVVEWVVRFTGPSPAAIRQRAAAEKARRQAEKQRKKDARRREREEQRERDQAAKRERQSRRDKARARAARFRTVTGITAQVVITLLTLGAASVAMLSVLAYAVPSLVAQAGLPVDASTLLGPTLMAVSGGMLVLCWFLGVVAAIWRANVRALPSFFHSFGHLLMCFVPVVGAPVSWGLAVWYAMGAMPRPPGEEFARYRGPRGNGWPVALALGVLGPFLTVAAAVFFDLTLWEMLQAMGED